MTQLNQEGRCINCNDLVNKTLGDEYCTKHFGLRAQADLWCAMVAIKDLQKLIANIQPKC